jgi:hypothetical protein
VRCCTVRVVLPVDAHLIIKYIYSRIGSQGSHPHLILCKFPCNNFVETVLENGFNITLINNKIIELRAILQRESQQFINRQNQSTTGKL